MATDMKPVILNQRLVFADFAKLFAMFVVTWGHCAQCMSGQTFPELFGKPGILIAFHMPLFMMVSGYFIHPERIREKKMLTYIWEKFQRLVVPAIAWYICFCLLTVQKPHLMGIFGFYWFLTSMFISLVLISIVAKCNKGDLGAAAIGGMLIGTLLQIFVVPTLFVIFQSLQEKVRPMRFDDDVDEAINAELEQYVNHANNYTVEE